MGGNDKKEQEAAAKKKKPFKLCFASQNLMGRSNIQIGKPLNMPNIITPKFYRTPYKTNCQNDGVDLKKQLEYLDAKGPREKYTTPLTENQKYGWYQIQLIDYDRNDRRLYFGKQTNPIIKEHLMNYENIR